MTITGADDAVEVKKLMEIEKEFPFVEWGILFSGTKVGAERYPQPAWIANAVTNLKKCSAHLCGAYSRSVLEKRGIDFLEHVHTQFERVQLNYNFSQNDKWDIEPLIKYLVRTDNLKKVILQNNKSNSRLINDVIGFPLIHSGLNILYDASGGRGTVIEKVEAPFPNHYTGYSGGIGPDNVEDVCKLITGQVSGSFSVTNGAAKLTQNNERYVWIDMESGVRTDNKFDLDKVWSVLEKAASYVAKDAEIF